MKDDHGKLDDLREDAVRSEYDFAKIKGGVRGKYYKAYRAGHSVHIHKNDGTTVVQHFKLEDGAVMLEPEVRKYFPDSDAVNRTLRSLIGLIPKRRPTSRSKEQSR